jgi:rRNA-processing protein FCF1
MTYGDIKHNFMKVMSDKFAVRPEEVDEKENKEVTTRDEIEKCIEKLLKLAYEEVKKTKPRYIGYPTCDIIACFLDAKDTLGIRFFDIFNQVVPSTYENKWEVFQKEKIEQKSDAILDALPNLGDSIESDFDEFSKHGVVSNVGLALALLDIYSFDENFGLIKGKKELLVEATKLLIKNKAPGKGWPYRYTRGDEEHYPHTLSTWLSMLALNYMPKEIGNAIADDWENTLENIKKEVREWLLGNINREGNYCSWSFRPKETTDYNPVATAQAILALHQAGIKDKDDDNIQDAIEYIKNNKNAMRDKGKLYKTDELIPEVGYITHISHPGIQHCLHALLMFGISPKDGIIQNLLKETVEMATKLKATDINLSNCYAILRPLLLYLSLTKPKILLDSATFISEFESFISKAENSIILIGEIDTAYAKVLEEQSKDRKINIKVYHPPKQDKLLIQDRNWNLIETDWRFENIHCAIVDKKEGLFSSKPFRETDYYNIIKRLNDDEVSNLINQLKGIIGIKPEEEIKEIVGKKFPEQSKIMTLEDLESNQLEGILEYYKPNPEYSEAIPSSLGFAGGEKRENIEVGFTSRGIISRVFMNGELENLIKKEIKDENLVMDESSAYLLLQSDKIEEIEENIKILLRRHGPVKGELHVLSKVHDRLDKLMKDLKSKEIYKGRVRKIGDKNIDAEIESERYYLSDNEKILITFTKKEKYGIITNTWEVAKRCMELGINVYSLVKFLDKNEKTYKMFRIPIDLLRDE